MKSFIKKAVVTFLCTLMTGLFVTGCGQPADTSITDIRTAGILKVGIPNYDTDLLHFDTEANGFRGVEAEVIDVLSQGIKVPVEYVELDKAEMLNALNTGVIDIAIGYIDINSAAINTYGKSVAYGGEDLYVVTPRGVYAGSLRVFQDKTIGVSDLIDNAGYENVYSNGVVNVITFSDSQGVMQALNNNDIAGYICYKSEAVFLEQSGEYQIQSCIELPKEMFTIVMLPNRTELIGGCNALLDEYLNGETTPTWVTEKKEDDNKNAINAESLFNN